MSDKSDCHHSNMVWRLIYEQSLKHGLIKNSE